MTPQEKAVIQAAIRLYHAHEFGRDQLGNALIEAGQGFDEAVRALIYSCNDCNHATHRCPGCGADIEHLDGACQECTERVEQEAREHLHSIYLSSLPESALAQLALDDPRMLKKIAALPDVEVTTSGFHVYRNAEDEPDGEPAWVRRTWEDVRIGDRVRLVTASNDGPTAYVKQCIHLPWHVDTLHPHFNQYHPEDYPLEWTAVRVTLDERKPIDFPPDGPIEIELTPAEVNAIELVGWPNRVGLIRGER